MKNKKMSLALIFVMLLVMMFNTTAFAEGGLEGDEAQVRDFILEHADAESIITGTYLGNIESWNGGGLWIDADENGSVSSEEAEMAIWYMQGMNISKAYLVTSSTSYGIILSDDTDSNSNDNVLNVDAISETDNRINAEIEDIYNKAVEQHPGIEIIDKNTAFDIISNNLNNLSEAHIIEDLNNISNDIKVSNQENLINFKDEYLKTKDRYGSTNKLIKFGPYNFMLLLDEASEVEVIDYLNFGNDYAPDYLISKEEYRPVPYMKISIISGPIENWDIGPIYKTDGSVDRNAIDVTKGLENTVVIDNAEDLLPEGEISDEIIIYIIEDNRINDNDQEDNSLNGETENIGETDSDNKDISNSVDKNINNRVDNDSDNVDNSQDTQNDIEDIIEVPFGDLDDFLEDRVLESDIEDIINALENDEDYKIFTSGQEIIIEDNEVTIIENKDNQEVKDELYKISDEISDYGFTLVEDEELIAEILDIISKEDSAYIIEIEESEKLEVVISPMYIEYPGFTQRIVEVNIVDSVSGDSVGTVGKIELDSIEVISVIAPVSILWIIAIIGLVVFALIASIAISFKIYQIYWKLWK